MTTETLRHYHRIGLVEPCKTDEWTGYRYYSQQEIVRLNTIKALQCMDLSLSEIKEILAYDDFHKIVATLKQAEKSADEKIAELHYAKTKIQRARTFYENKLCGAQPNKSVFVKPYPQRVILLSDTMQAPTLDNLWNSQTFLRSAFRYAQASVFVRRSGRYLRTERTRPFICDMHEIYKNRRPRNTAARRLFMRRLHGRKPRANHRAIDRNGKKRIQHCSPVHRAIDCAVGHTAMELPSATVATP